MIMKSDQLLTVSVHDHGDVSVKRGTTLLELKESLRLEEKPGVPVVGALYNNRIMGLEYPLNRDCRVKYLSTRTEEGAEIYRRSLSVLLHAAFIGCCGEQETLKIEHSLNKGYFFSFIDRKPITEELVKRIEERMREFVSRDLPFEKCELEREDALDFFRKIGAWDRYYLLKYDDRAKVILYKFCDCYNLAQGPLVPRTGHLRVFSLVYYPPGLVLTFPDTERPDTLPPKTEQKKLFQIYSEHREWSKILDVSSAGKLNRLIIKGKIDDLIWVSEGLHEKKIAQIADIITRNAKTKRIVTLAGPSSSGKTTFAKRLTIQLLANGIGPELISLDNYYLPRERMPRNEEGDADLEDLYALDVELINRHLRQLLRGERIKVPRYDFKTGRSEREAQEMELRKNQILIVEGIHGLNENLTASIGSDEKCKIYISALTQLNLDFINRIPTSTVRLLRRIVRDHQFRSYTARQTLAQWPQVRAGEGKHIFPFQEDADIMFNSSLVYEMSVMKLYVEPLLKDIEEEDEMYTQAKRLLHFTANFLDITSDHVPFTSILREFIGGSGFEY
jgi:uridine kinase